MRQFAADKKTPGKSLYLLSRDKDYSIVGHVFSQLFPEDYDRVSGAVDGVAGGGGGARDYAAMRDVPSGKTPGRASMTGFVFSQVCRGRRLGDEQAQGRQRCGTCFEPAVP